MKPPLQPNSHVSIGATGRRRGEEVYDWDKFANQMSVVNSHQHIRIVYYSTYYTLKYFHFHTVEYVQLLRTQKIKSHHHITIHHKQTNHIWYDRHCCSYCFVTHYLSNNKPLIVTHSLCCCKKRHLFCCEKRTSVSCSVQLTQHSQICPVKLTQSN